MFPLPVAAAGWRRCRRAQLLTLFIETAAAAGGKLAHFGLHLLTAATLFSNMISQPFCLLKTTRYTCTNIENKYENPKSAKYCLY